VVSAATARTWNASELTLSSGTGALDGTVLVVTAGDATNTVLLSLTTDFRSSDFPAIHWLAAGVPDGADVRLLWKSDVAPNKTNVAPVTVEAGRLRPAILSRNPAWLGRVKGIALAIRAPLTEPVRIEGVTAKPMSAPQIAGDRRANGSRSKASTGRRSTRSPAAPICRTCPAAAGRHRHCARDAAALGAAPLRAAPLRVPRHVHARRAVRRRLARARRALDRESRAPDVRDGEPVRRQVGARQARRGRGRAVVCVHREGARRDAGAAGTRLRRRQARTTSAGGPRITSIRTTCGSSLSTT
jgi:hypothetical protein